MPEPLITQKMSSVIPATCCTSESTLPSALIYTTLHAKVSSDAAGQSSWRLSAGCLLNQSCQIKIPIKFQHWAFAWKRTARPSELCSMRGHSTTSYHMQVSTECLAC